MMSREKRYFGGGGGGVGGMGGAGWVGGARRSGVSKGSLYFQRVGTMKETLGPENYKSWFRWLVERGRKSKREKR